MNMIQRADEINDQLPTTKWISFVMTVKYHMTVMTGQNESDTVGLFGQDRSRARDI